ncbi:Na/Pi symporter [Euzebya sp.]|uniref:Na/Pi symporter n=1 Tax=Euzebya sp. TaxID=1971409 RepID=UPI003515AB90
MNARGTPADRPSRDGADGRGAVIARALLVIGLLYAFLVGVSLLEDGIVALGPDVQDEMFRSVTNPLGGLFVGILATVLAQSSSVTTATIVGLVGSGLLGVEDAVPMIMGANIGTTVTNTLASLGHLRRPQEFKAAFAAATVHDFFNVLSVIVLLPLELATGVLSRVAESLSSALLGTGGGEFESPIKQAVSAPAEVIESVLTGVGATGPLLGVLFLVAGLALIFTALAFITKNMRALVADRMERTINDVLSRGGGIAALAAGAVITVAVQSSSITTSVLIPLAASGILSLRNTYPVTLGANVGTTVTALLASLATDRPEALTVALVHTAFNLAGIALFYPVPALRDIPIRLAERGSELAAASRRLAVVYTIGIFILVPLAGVLLLR